MSFAIRTSTLLRKPNIFHIAILNKNLHVHNTDALQASITVDFKKSNHISLILQQLDIIHIYIGFFIVYFSHTIL